MPVFLAKKEAKPLNFATRADAFNYMLSRLLEKGDDPLLAAQQADEFAEIFAKNNGIPLRQEPELTGVDKYISMAEKIGNYIESHPKVVEYGVPALTFIAGLFTGKQVEQHIAEPPLGPAENGNIDFDKIPD